MSAYSAACHTFFEWSGGNRIVALVCPINESIWEHMKLLFFPIIPYTIFFAFKCKKYKAVTASMLLGNIAGVFFMPVIFYTYSGVYGKHVTPIDIAIFFISTAVVFYLAYHLIIRQKKKERHGCDCVIYMQVENYGITFGIVSVIIAMCFFVFTFYPPNWGIFISPE